MSRRQFSKTFFNNACLFSLLIALMVSVTWVKVWASVPESLADMLETTLPAVVSVFPSGGMDGGNNTRKWQYGDTSEDRDQEVEKDVEELVKKFFQQPKSTNKNNGNFPKPAKGGSGFLISPEGYIITSSQVIQESKEAIVLVDNAEYKGEVIGVLKQDDLALVKITREEPFPYLQWAASDDLRFGDWVVSVGSRFKNGGNVAAGMVSYRLKSLEGDKISGNQNAYIMASIPRNRFNFGGPLLTVDGKVVGVNTGHMGNSQDPHMSIAVPSNKAQFIIDQLINNKSFTPGYVGVSVQNIDEGIASSLGMTEVHGILVLLVFENSPAAAAGIKAGDVILSFNNKKTIAFYDFRQYVELTAVGATVPMELWRDGRKITVDVTVGDKSQFQNMGRIESLGIRVKTCPDIRETAQSEKTVLCVTDVDENLEESNPLKVGFIIASANMEEVSTIEDFKRAIANNKEKGLDAVLLGILAKDGSLYFKGVPLE